MNLPIGLVVLGVIGLLAEEAPSSNAGQSKPEAEQAFEKVSQWTGERVTILGTKKTSCPQRRDDTYFLGLHSLADPEQRLPDRRYWGKTGVIVESKLSRLGPSRYFSLETIVQLDSGERIGHRGDVGLGFHSELEAAKGLVGKSLWAKRQVSLLVEPCADINSAEIIAVRGLETLLVKKVEFGHHLQPIHLLLEDVAGRSGWLTGWEGYDFFDERFRLPDNVELATNFSRSKALHYSNRFLTEDPEPARAAASVNSGVLRPSPSVVTGTLVDLYTGRALASREVTWTIPQGHGKITRNHKTVTDGEGRFRLEIPDISGMASPRLSVDGVGGLDYRGFQSGGNEFHGDVGQGLPAVKIESAARDFRSHEVSLTKAIVAGGEYLGTIRLADDSIATSDFGAVCGGGRTTSKPATDMLFFIRYFSEAWEHSFLGWAALTDDLPLKGWSPPWKAAVCVESSSRVVGQYRSNEKYAVALPGQGMAVSVVWSVKVIRLSDGKVFKTVVASNPPEFGDTLRGASSPDPWPQLLTWLETKVR